ncbi:MAG: SMP-30/gluconolactonase/LRE family protein [Chroococcidiopsidaceae cyanobacterium CP_BM_ER_R8_30]|nr:SMP-30/gluconolactonase/LRE family protein [Chroococcidiopsidaceae cyanobacterium CP_BM_ER_R8_30]
MSEAIEIYDERMRALVSPTASLQKIADGARHSEGPVYIPKDDCLVWSDVKANCLFRWSATEGVSVMLEPSQYQNGHALDLEGRLVACSQGERAIVRREHNGMWHVLVDRYQGKRLNSPNDLVVKRDGTIWFTDPPYGINELDQGYGGEQEQPGSFVYRFDPATGEIDAVVTDLTRPNGLAFSPDESLMYVSDSASYNIPNGAHHICVYEVVDGRRVTNGRVFAVIEPGYADGFRVDEHGNVFSTSKDSVQVYAPDGTRLGKIPVPETCSNLTFGGQEGNRLFVTLGKSVYAIDLNTRGMQQP